MRTKIITVITMLFATAAYFLSSCSDEANTPFNGAGMPATITVESAGDASATAFSVTITPSANAAAYTFAIGTPADYALFVSRSSTLKTIKDVSGNRDTTVIFNNLAPAAAYAVFAQAYTAEGYRSEVTAFTVPTKSARVSTHIDEVTTMYAVVTTEMHGDIKDYIALCASKEVYGEYVSMFAESGYSEMEMLEELYSYGMASYYDSGITEGYLLNGSTNYEYIFVVLPYTTDDTPLDIVKTEYVSPSFVPGLLLPSAGTITVSEITDNTAHIAVTPGSETYGYYTGLVKAEVYDVLFPDDVSYVWYQELPFYSFPLFEADDDTWSGLEPGTEYVIGVTPFNINGADGYGPFYTGRFTTTGTAPEPPAPAPAPGSVGSERPHGNKFILQEGRQLSPYKKSLIMRTAASGEIKPRI